MDRQARANVEPVRQRTQYTCMSTSMAMALRALGYPTNEDQVNKVMGAQPMRGAAWEQALACAQHYGVRATLTVPSTVTQLKEWTDAGKPVMIAWNPEGRDWSHASLVFDVTDRPETLASHQQLIDSPGPGLYVWVADPNLPHPEKTVRIVHEDEFYSRWSEKWPNYLVRRPACCLEREITPSGRQVMASSIASRYSQWHHNPEWSRAGDDDMSDKHSRRNKSKKPKSQKDKTKIPEAPKRRNQVVEEMVQRGWGSGSHHNRNRDVQKGRSRKPKHKKNLRDMTSSVADRWLKATGDSDE